METSEKVLYHQVHPAKLITDGSTALLSFFLLWHHELVPTILVATVPSVAVSWILIGYSDLEGIKDSPIGRYLARFMNGPAMFARLLGFIVSAFGAWYGNLATVVAGLVVVIFAWTYGLPLRRV